MSAPSSSSGWLDPRTGRRILALVMAGLALFAAWDAYRQTGDGWFALRLATLAALSVWLAFRLALWAMRLLHRLRGEG